MFTGDVGTLFWCEVRQVVAAIHLGDHCRRTAHIGRSGAPLDFFVETVVLGYLCGENVGAGLHDAEPQVDVVALRTQREALTAQKNQLGTLFGKGMIDAVQLENGSVELKTKITAIDKELAEATRISPAVALMGGDDPATMADVDLLIERWQAASPDFRGKVITELMDVIVHPVPRGARTFDPSLIEIRWR